ncbi:MAG: Fatty acid desaturase [Bacteroidota bacterium]
MSVSNYIHLFLFPCIQLGFFGLVLIPEEFGVLTICAVLLGALALNFTLHIFIHHMVHFLPKRTLIELPLGIAFSWLIGIPFHYYTMSHWNHHKHNNQEKDFTSTWRRDKQGVLRPKPFLIYTIFWPFVSNTSLKNQFAQSKVEGYNSRRNELFIGIEFLVNLLLYALLVRISLVVLCAYFLMIYVGWVFISAHNYGQHIPKAYAKFKGFSFSPSWYNRLFANNGLHEEHHETPQLTYWKLSKLEQGAEVQHPHLVAGFFHHKAKE